MCDRDNFMSAEEALRYGLVDEIVPPNEDKLRSLSLPPPQVAKQLFGGAARTDGNSDEDYEFGKLVSE